MVTSFQGMSTAVTGDLGPMAPKPLEKGDGSALQEADRFERRSLPTNVHRNLMAIGFDQDVVTRDDKKTKL